MVLYHAHTEEEDVWDLDLATLNKGDRREGMMGGGARAMDMEWWAIKGGHGGHSYLAPNLTTDCSSLFSLIWCNLIDLN